MTEEVKEPEVKEEVAPDPIEESARGSGWVSKEEWEAQGKDPAEHRSAKEFTERGELYKSIHSTKRELQQAKAALDSLTKHHAFVYEKAYIEADKKLRAEFRAAVKAGDDEAVEAIETERAELQKDHNATMTQFQREQAAARAFNQVPPELEDWMSRNTWYNTDIDLRNYADAIGKTYLQKGGTREGLLAHVEKTTKAKFPESFGGTRPQGKITAANPVGAPRGGARKTVAEEAGLSELETKIMNDLVKSGTMTKEQYIKELKG